MGSLSKKIRTNARAKRMAEKVAGPLFVNGEHRLSDAGIRPSDYRGAMVKLTRRHRREVTRESKLVAAEQAEVSLDALDDWRARLRQWWYRTVRR